MSKKPAPQTVVVLDQRGRAMSTADALQTREQLLADRKTRRQGSTWYRNRRQLWPWAGFAGVHAVGLALVLVRALVDLQTIVVVTAALNGLVTAGVWMAARDTGVWRTRLYVAGAAAAVWLSWLAAVGLSWWAPVTLMATTVVLSARWWQTNRHPYPAGVMPDEEQPDQGPVHERWRAHVANDAGVLPGSYLTDRDTRKKNAETYTVNLVPGKHTLTFALSGLERISSGLLEPMNRIVLEAHPSNVPTQLRLTVVKASPIELTVPYEGARITGDHRHLLELGPYGDGDGFARWRMWQPGEEPMTGSWLGGLIIGGTGIGKSRLMELLATGYIACGCAVVWFCDPQDGASSHALKQHADWYVDGDRAEVMLEALERIAYWRAQENAAKGWTRFDPTPERPGIVVFLDECHETFARDAKRWAALARMTQKVGISFVGLSQYAGLASLGNEEPLRAALLGGNCIIMRTESRQNGQLIPGLQVNPLELPNIPGFGYVLKRGDEGRTAPFRAQYLARPAEWLAKYPGVPLDQLSANAAGDVYKRRHVIEAEIAGEKLGAVEKMRAGGFVMPQGPELEQMAREVRRTGKSTDDVVMEHLGFTDAPAEAAGLQVPTFPPAPKGERPQDKPAGANTRDGILARLAEGDATIRDLCEATGASETRVRQLLAELGEAEQVEKVSTVRPIVYRRILAD